MSKTTLKNFIIALSLFVFAVTVFGIMLRQISSEGEKLNNQIEVLAGEQARETSYYQLLRTAEDTTEERQSLSSYFLSKDSESIDFLNQVENMAPTAGVILQTNELKLVTEKDKKDWVQVSFTFSGSRERVQNFIKLLETLPYLSRITSVNLGAESSTKWRADLTMQVRVLAYDK